MAAIRFNVNLFSIIGTNSAVLPGSKLYFYISGSDTPLATYSDVNLTTPNTNPVVSDANGRFSDIFLQAANYKVVLRTSADVPIQTLDPISGVSIITAGSVDADGITSDTTKLKAITDKLLVPFEGTGAVAVSPSDVFNRQVPVSVLRFIPRNLWDGIRNGTNTTTLTTYIQAAIDYAASLWIGGSQLGGGAMLYFPAGRYKTGPLIWKNGVSARGDGKLHSQLMLTGNNVTMIAASSNTATLTSAGGLYYGSFADMAFLSYEGAQAIVPTGQVLWDAVGFSRWTCTNIYFGWGAGCIGIRMTGAITAGSGGPAQWYNSFYSCLIEKHYVGAGGIGALLGDSSASLEQITTWNFYGGYARGNGDGTGTAISLQSGTGVNFYGMTFEAVGNGIILGSAAGTRQAHSVNFYGCYWEGCTVNYSINAGCTNNFISGGFETGGSIVDNGTQTSYGTPGKTKTYQSNSASDVWEHTTGGASAPAPKFKRTGTSAHEVVVESTGGTGLFGVCTGAPAGAPGTTRAVRIRLDGGVGSTLYVWSGAAWTAVPGV